MIVNLNLVSAALCCIAFLFFLIGCIGFSSDEGTAKDVAWIHYKHESDNQLWFALRILTFRMDFGVFGVATGSVKYDHQDCNFNFCDECSTAGQSAFGLLIVALLATMVTGILSSGIVGAFSYVLQLANVVIAGIAVLASIIGVSVFMNDCYNKIQDDINEDKDLTWGPGSVLSLIGMLFMMAVVVLQIVATLTGVQRTHP